MMNKFFILILILIPQFTLCQVEKKIRAEAAEIMYKSYCESFNLIGKECNITFDEFTKYIYLKYHFTLSNTNIRFYFYNSEKYLDEKSFLFIEKDSSYFLYDDFQDPDGRCFTKTTEKIFQKIAQNQNITEKNINELINIHLIYRNLNGHIYNLVMTHNPFMDLLTNSCSFFSIKNSDGSFNVCFRIWNVVSSDIMEILLESKSNEIKIVVENIGNMGPRGIKI